MRRGTYSLCCRVPLLALALLFLVAMQPLPSVPGAAAGAWRPRAFSLAHFAADPAPQARPSPELAAPLPSATGIYTAYLPLAMSSGSPVIASFSASPALIAPGKSSTLSWSVSGATSLSISPGIGKVTGSSITVNPAATTEYTLTASNSAGSTSATANVRVDSTAGDLAHLLPLAYYHIQDSDGARPIDGAVAILAFEPGGIAQLYVAATTQAIAYRGAYSYFGGMLSLSFSDADFKPDVRFALDTTSATATMPFKLFSTTPGTSTWERKQVQIEHNLRLIYNAVTINEQLPHDQALDRVIAYARTLIDLGTTADRSTAAIAPAACPAEPKLLAIEPTGNGVTLLYEFADGGECRSMDFSVQLYGWGFSSAPVSGFTPSPLASDPRVHLDPVAPLDPTFDPPNKTALFITPFENRDTLFWSGGAAAIGAGMAQYSRVAEKKAIFERRGYTVEQLVDTDASVVNIISALLQSPGFVMFTTHGAHDGGLITGSYIGVKGDMLDKIGVWRRFQIERLKIAAAGYGDLLDYTWNNQRAMRFGYIANDLRPDSYDILISLTPPFWKWLHEKGANFSRSLVYLFACDVGAAPALGQALQARAMFAFSGAIPGEVGGAVAQYLVASLARRSHSPEETFYNIIRVTNTRQLIYKEDTELEGWTEWDAEGTHLTLATHFSGYFRTGSSTATYDAAGWLNPGPTADLGTIWWLLFSGRWGQDTDLGASNIMDCWNTFWSSGKRAGLLSPACNAREIGRAPNQDEVAYALYLLTGKSFLSFSGTPIPRWTMSDGNA